MKPDPNKVADALQDWVTEEIKGSTKRYHELGKFLFTASTTSSAFFVGIKRFLQEGDFDSWIIFSLCFSVISFVIAIFLIKPQEWIVTKNTDLTDTMAELINKSIRLVYAWIFIWIISLLFGIISIAR